MTEGDLFFLEMKHKNLKEYMWNGEDLFWRAEILTKKLEVFGTVQIHCGLLG